MADNTQLSTNIGTGDKAVSAEFTFSGDTAKAFGSFLGTLSGSEGAWTYTLLVGGAGAVTAGVQRVTLASNDPAVTALELLDNAISGAGFNITQAGGAAVPIGAGLEATAIRVTLPTDGTGKVNAAQSGSWTVSVAGVSTAANQTTIITALAGGLPAALGAGGGLKIDGSGTALPISGTVTANAGSGTFTVSGAVTQSGTWNITNISGTVSLPTGASTLAEQQTQTASLGVIDDWDESDRAKVNPIVGQAGVQGGSGSVSNTTQRVVLATDVALPTGTNTIGAVVPVPATSGGLSIARDIDLDNGTLTVVKNSAGQVYGWTITNTTTATVYVKFYDATSGTLGTGTPVLTIGIPGNSSDDTTLAQSFGGQGIAFSTGICVGAGTGVLDNDNTDPGANGVVANILYK